MNIYKQPTEAEINEAAEKYYKSVDMDSVDNYPTCQDCFTSGVSWLQNYQAQQPEKQVKGTEEIIIQYASRVYEHQANEPQFDCDMVEFQMSDCIDMLNEYASQFQTPTIGFNASLIEGMRPGDAYGSLALGISEGEQWVSVETDLLPPMDEKTEIILEDGVRHLGHYDGADNDGKDRWFCDNNDYHYPTHWKRLCTAPGQSSQPQPNAIIVIEERIKELKSEYYLPFSVDPLIKELTDLLTKLKKQPCLFT